MTDDRALEPGTVIRDALQIYRDHAGVLIPAALAVFALQAIAAVALTGGAGVIVSLVSLVLSTFYQGMVVQLVRDVQDGRLDSSVGQLFSSVTPVLLPLIAVSILFGLGVAIGLVLLLVPGLFLMTIWSVAGPVTVLEHPGVFAAFRRSHALVRGNGWQVFTVILVVFVGLLVVSSLAAIVASPLGDVGRALVQWIVNAGTAPVAGLTAAVLYLTLRARAGEPPLAADVPPAPEAPGAANPFGA